MDSLPAIVTVPGLLDGGIDDDFQIALPETIHPSEFCE